METTKSIIQSVTILPWLSGLKFVRCNRFGCSKSATQRRLTVSNTGITFDRQWFCGYTCFEPSLADSIAKLIEPVANIGRVPKSSLPLVLLKRGRITPGQLARLVEYKDETGTEAGEALVQLGYINEAEVISTRASQWGCPVLPGAPGRSSMDVRIPITLMRSYSMVPLHYTKATNKVAIGFSHKVEYAALYAVEQVAGLTTQACFISSTTLNDQLDKYAEAGLCEDLAFCSYEPPAKMAQILCSYGSWFNAYEFSLGICADYLWARMKTSAGLNDILFSLRRQA